MAPINKAASVEDFYRHWSPRVFAFCSLLLGNETSAERVVAEAFLAYAERDLDLDLVRLPEELMALAWNLSKPITAKAQIKSEADATNLAYAILRLPLEERAVFILRNVMAMDELDAGSILGLPLAALRRTWFHAMLELRKLLPANFLKEQSA